MAKDSELFYTCNVCLLCVCVCFTTKLVGNIDNYSNLLLEIVLHVLQTRTRVVSWNLTSHEYSAVFPFSTSSPNPTGAVRFVQNVQNHAPRRIPSWIFDTVRSVRGGAPARLPDNLIPMATTIYPTPRLFHGSLGQWFNNYPPWRHNRNLISLQRGTTRPPRRPRRVPGTGNDTKLKVPAPGRQNNGRTARRNRKIRRHLASWWTRMTRGTFNSYPMGTWRKKTLKDPEL